MQDLRLAIRCLRIALLLLVCTCGCIDRTRTNSGCEWTRDSAYPLDLTSPADQGHLVADAQLAEELAVRYADAQHKRQFGYQGHGGLIDHGRVYRECLTGLVGVIERSHEVTAGQINRARAQRNPRFDIPVMLSFGAIYALGAMVLSGWLRRKFFDPSQAIGMIVTVGASMMFSALGLQAGAVWTAIWECVRIGNDHLGAGRAARAPWDQHLAGLFVVGIVLFWTVSAFVVRSRAEAE